MFANFKLYAIIAGIIFLVIAGLSGALYLSNKAIREQAADIATIKAQNVALQSSITELQDDAAATKINENALYDSLNTIRTKTDADKDKIVIPASVLHDDNASALQKIINDRTKATLKHFEVLSGKK